MALTLTYRHDHNCKYKGEVYEDRPSSNGVVAWIIVPTCEETMTELTLVRTETY